MARFVQRTVVVRGGPRRSTLWLGFAPDTTVTALAANASAIDQFFTFSESSTIVRTRGTLWIGSDQESNDEIAFGALGMGVVSTPAFTAGVALVPTPSTEMEDDLWFQWLPWFTNLLFSDATGFQANLFSRYDFDSKAMRKVHNGDTLVVVLENDIAVGVNFMIMFRMLLKLNG